MPRAQRTTKISHPGTVIINPAPAQTGDSVVETTQSATKNFWEEQDVLTKPEGKDYVIYLYRLQPATLGHKGYIAKFSSPVTQEEIKESFGGYEYRISLHKGSKWICQDVFSISAPPKAIGAADPGMFSAMTPGAAAGSDPAQTTRDVLAFVKERLEKERLEKQNDPAFIASLSLVQKTAEQAIATVMNRNSNPAAEQMQSSMMQMMMTMMGNMTQTLMTRAMERPEKSTVGGLKEMLELLPLLGVKIGGAGLGGGKLDPFAAIGQSLIGAAPQILAAGAEFMGKYHDIARERTRQTELQYNAIALQHNAQPVQPTPPAAARPPAPFAAAPPPAQPGMPAQPAPAGFAVEPFDTPPPAIPFQPVNPATTDQPSDNYIKRRIVELIARGMSGDALMAFISGVNENFALTMKACTEEQIRSFFSADPILSQALSLPNFDGALAEALQYLHPEGIPSAVPN